MSPNPFPFEIHITIDANSFSTAYFEDVCAIVGVKPLIIENFSKTEITTDYITQSSLTGFYRNAYEEMESIVKHMELHGFDVLRKKIETSPYKNPIKRIGSKYYPNTYLESHIKFKLDPIVNLEEFKIAIYEKFKTSRLSRNSLNSRLFITTQQNDEDYYDIFSDYNETIIEYIRNNWKATVNPIFDKELVVFDSNREHDKVWFS